MRTLLHWLGTAITAQPFYSEEIRMIQLVFQVWQHRVLSFDRLISD